MQRRAFLQTAAAASLGLAAGPAAARADERLVGVVTADLDDRVVIVDLRTGRILARVATPADPRSAETVADGTLALVACTRSGAVVVVDPAARRVRRELGGFGAPRYAAAGRDGIAYVTDSLRGELVAVDVVRGRVARRLEVGEGARHLGIDPAGRRVWVALGNQAPRIAIVEVDDPRRPRLLRRLPPVDRAHDVVFGDTGQRVWVTSGTEHAIAVHDARTGRVLRRLPGGDPPQHVAIVPGAVLVTSGDDGSMHVRDPVRGRLRRSVRVPIGSFNVAAAAPFVVSPSLSGGTLSILDAAGTERHRLRIGRAAHDACVVAG